MGESFHAFEQIHTDYPLFKEEVEEWVDEQDTDEWLIEFLDRENRRTTIGGLAFYAAQFDDSAEVTAL